MTFYLYLDGDDIGNKLARCFIENDETGLAVIIQTLSSVLEQIHKYLKSQGCEIIFFAADGIVCKGKELDFKDFARYIRIIGRPHYTFSVGIGADLQSAYFALQYAKAVGKNKTVVCWDGRDFTILSTDSNYDQS